MEDYFFINALSTSTNPITFDPACLTDPTMNYHFGHNYTMGAITTESSSRTKDLYSSVFPPSPLSPCETLDSSGEESKNKPSSPRQPRIGGKTRPRLKRSSDSQDRISHKQVERKYRDRVKAGMELLERTCAEPGKEDRNGAPRRPSKIEILAEAVEYIQQLRQERDAALQDMEALRSTWRANMAWQQGAVMENASRRGSEFNGSLFDSQLQIFE